MNILLALDIHDKEEEAIYPYGGNNELGIIEAGQAKNGAGEINWTISVGKS